MNKNNLISIAGGFWCVVGLFLIVRGVDMYQLAGQEQHATQVAIILSGITAALIGLVKGRFVLSKRPEKIKIGFMDSRILLASIKYLPSLFIF